MKISELDIIIEYYKKENDISDVLLALRKLSINGHKVLSVFYDEKMDYINCIVPHFGWNHTCSDKKCKHKFDKNKSVVRIFGASIIVEGDYNIGDVNSIYFKISDNVFITVSGKTTLYPDPVWDYYLEAKPCKEFGE